MLRRLTFIAALVVGSLPGFFLSFVAAYRLPTHAADSFLLYLSIAIIVTGLVPSTFEASLVAEYSRQIADEGSVWASDFFRLTLYGILRALPASLAFYVAMVALYHWAGGLPGGYREALIAGSVLATFPVVATSSAVFSSYLTACSKLVVVFLSAGFRGLPTVATLFLTANLFCLSASYVCGEVCRLAFLTYWSLRVLNARQNSMSEDRITRVIPPRISAWALQVCSMLMSQGGPLIGKAFLASAPAGNVTSGDNAEKGFYGVTQMTVSALVLPNIAKMPHHLREKSLPEVRGVLRREVRKILIRSSALALTGVGGLCLVIVFVRPYLPYPTARAVAWSIILMLAIPGFTVGIWCSRVLLIGRLSKVLPIISASTILVNLLSCIILFWVCGPIGVMWSFFATQTLGGAVAYFLCIRLLPSAYLRVEAERIAVESPGRRIFDNSPNISGA